ALDGIGVVQDLRHGSQAVGGAGSGADDLVIGGQGVLVHAVNDGLQVVAGGGRDDDLLGAGFGVSHGLVLLGEETGALQHHVHTQLAPGQLGGVGVLVDGDLLAVHGDGVLTGHHSVTVVTALGGI